MFAAFAVLAVLFEFVVVVVLGKFVFGCATEYKEGAEEKGVCSLLCAALVLFAVAGTLAAQTQGKWKRKAKMRGGKGRAIKTREFA